MTPVRVFIDSGFTIAAYRKRDINHEQAMKTMTNVLEKDQLVLYELILAEIVTFFFCKDGYQDVLRIMTALNASVGDERTCDLL